MAATSFPRTAATGRRRRRAPGVLGTVGTLLGVAAAVGIAVPTAPARPASPRRRVPPPRPVAPPVGDPAPAAPAGPAEPSTPVAPTTAPRLRRGRRLLFEVFLTAGAVLGIAATGLTVSAAQGGWRPLVVRSASMEPTVAVGSMVLTREIDASEIRVGDVVAVDLPDRTRVMHRVVAVERRGAVADLTLKGDANEDVDPAPVPVRRALRLEADVPFVGRAVAWTATAPGGFVLGCAVTAGFALVLRGRGRARRRAG